MENKLKIAQARAVEELRPVIDKRKYVFNIERDGGGAEVLAYALDEEKAETIARAVNDRAGMVKALKTLAMYGRICHHKPGDYKEIAEAALRAAGEEV